MSKVIVAQRERIFIIGAGGLAREVFEMLVFQLKNTQHEFGGFFAPSLSCELNPTFAEHYRGNESDYDFEEGDSIVVAIGDISLRKKCFETLKERGLHFFNVIHPSAIVSPQAKLGEGNIIGPQSIIGPDVVIGSNNLFNCANIIHHDCQIGSHNNLYTRVVMTGQAYLGDENEIGTNASLLPSTGLIYQNKLAAGSVLCVSSEETHCTFAGNPAGIVKRRKPLVSEAK